MFVQSVAALSKGQLLSLTTIRSMLVVHIQKKHGSSGPAPSLCTAKCSPPPSQPMGHPSFGGNLHTLRAHGEGHMDLGGLSRETVLITCVIS